MINAEIARVHKKLDFITVDGPWTGPDGITWKISIHPAESADFKKALKRAGIKPRSVKERTDSLGEVDYSDFDDIRSTKSKKGLEKARSRAKDRVRTQQDAAKAVRAELEGIEEIGYELADYPTGVLSLAEIETMRDDIAKCLVNGITTVNPDSTEEVWEADRVAETFTTSDVVPDTIERVEDGEKFVQALYLRGVVESVALCAYVYRCAVQTHLFLERRVPLESN